MSAGADMLADVVDVLREHAPPDLAAWFAQGVDQYIATGRPLDVCLGIQPIDRAAATRQVYVHLVAAYQLAGSVRNLEKHIRRFEVAIWPKVRREAEPPERLTPMQRELYLAFRCGVGVPTGKSQLAQLVKKLSGDCVRPDSTCV